MSFRPAYDEITLAHGDITVRLRPSLRAASTLERLHDGFAPLFRRVTEFHTGTIREIIRIAATDRHDASAFLASMSRLPLRTCVEIAQAPVAKLCLDLAPAPQDDAKPSPNSKPVPWPKFFRDLFGIATGWLGWSPEAAWNATPTEITEAYKGRLNLLKAVFGTSEANPESQPDPHGTLDRAGLDKLRGQGRLR